jgi:hypothetical protein
METLKTVGASQRFAGSIIVTYRTKKTGQSQMAILEVVPANAKL